MKIAILLGGESLERDVSFSTGKAVAAALKESGNEVYLFDPASSRPFLGTDPSALSSTIDSVPPGGELPGISGEFMETVFSGGLSRMDMTFIALHGGFGEDGTIQAVLKAAGIPFTGSGTEASALAMDKIKAKRIFIQGGLNTPEWVAVSSETARAMVGKDHPVRTNTSDERNIPDFLTPDDGIESITAAISFPLIVKPSGQGSSVGMTLVKNEEEFPSALGFAADYGTEVLIERYIPGRELTVAVLEGNPLPVVEIKPDKGLYDYRSKYSTGGSKYSVPAEVSPEIVSGMSDDALAAFGLLGCSTYGRVDFRLDPEGVWYILEVNTLPGMTATSLVPMAARAAGMEFSELVLRIVGTGMSGSV